MSDCLTLQHIWFFPVISVQIISSGFRIIHKIIHIPQRAHIPRRQGIFCCMSPHMGLIPLPAEYMTQKIGCHLFWISIRRDRTFCQWVSPMFADIRTMVKVRCCWFNQDHKRAHWNKHRLIFYLFPRWLQPVFPLSTHSSFFWFILPHIQLWQYSPDPPELKNPL